MERKNISFIATKYRNKPVRVSFYTKKGERVRFTGTRKASVKAPVRFFAETR